MTKKTYERMISNGFKKEEWHNHKLEMYSIMCRKPINKSLIIKKKLT